MKRALETDLAASLPASVPFVGPEALERQRNVTFKARLGANESTFGPSPRALQAMRDAASEAWMYGDPESFDLRHALAASLSIKPSEVVLGEGIDGLLGYAVRLYVGAGDAVVTSDGAYPTFNYHVAGFGGRLIKVPYVDDKEDPESLLRAAKENDAKLIYLANPDNPMGSWHSADVIDDMIARLPDGCLLVLDEAYAEFAPDGAVPAIDTGNPQVIRMRTFSKAHGMAGMRIGYAFGEAEVIRGFEKIRNHFGMNRISQAAAMAALADTGWVADVLGQVAAARERIVEIARDNGLAPLASATNFVTIDCGRDAAFAKAVLDQLVAQDIFVRMPFAEPGNRCIRISAGTVAELDMFAKALPQALAAAQAG
ncbi:pyridoxal phosphate-dependent aminotransferase [bacterium]|nr:pyridoxal phosphate-dependent aminotransferase [bacterium]